MAFIKGGLRFVKALGSLMSSRVWDKEIPECQTSISSLRRRLPERLECLASVSVSLLGLEFFRLAVKVDESSSHVGHSSYGSSLGGSGKHNSPHTEDVNDAGEVL